MPFSGPEGQGPFEDFDECVEAMSDEEGVDDPEALCAFWEKLDKENQNNVMTDTNDVEYRQYYQASPDDISYRELSDDEEGLFSIRMPVASTGEVRNEGDEPLARSEIEGMARQINEGDVGVFLAHGQSFEITDARFGQTERLGNWRDAEVKTRETRQGDGEEGLLFASAEMMDPETLPNIGPIRNALGTLKEQAKRGIGISSSIGWRDAEDSPGGNDLMEVSIVGIPADPRTFTQSAAVARAAVEAGADPDLLVEAVREAVTGDRDNQGTNDDMTDTDTESDAENQASDTETEEEASERQDAPEWAERMLEMQEAQTDILQAIADRVTDEDEDDDDDEDEEENADDDEDDDEDEQAADVTQEQREALETLREGGFSVEDLDLPEPENDEEQAAETDETSDDTEADDTSEPARSYNKYGLKPT